MDDVALCMRVVDKLVSKVLLK